MARGADVLRASVQLAEAGQELLAPHDALRYALLFAVQTAPLSTLQWLHLLAGHGTVLGVDGFLFAHVSRFSTSASALLFLTSLPNAAVVTLLRLTRWLPGTAELRRLEGGADSLAKFRFCLARLRFAHLLRGNVAEYDITMGAVLDGEVPVATLSPSAARARLLLVAGVACGPEFESSATLVGDQCFTCDTVPLGIASFAWLGVTSKKRRAVAAMAVDKGGRQNVPHRGEGSIFESMNAADVDDPAESFAAQDLLRLRAMTAITDGSMANAGMLYMNYICRLVSRGFLSVGDGRPTTERAHSFIQSLLPTVDTVNEFGKVVKGRKGYRVQTTLPNFLSQLGQWCAIVGWSISPELSASLRNALSIHARNVENTIVVRSPPALYRHVMAALERLAAGPPGWLDELDVSELPRLDTLMIHALIASNEEVGRRTGSVEGLRVGNVSYYWSAVADWNWGLGTGTGTPSSAPPPPR